PSPHPDGAQEVFDRCRRGAEDPPHRWADRRGSPSRGSDREGAPRQGEGEGEARKGEEAPGRARPGPGAVQRAAPRRRRDHPPDVGRRQMLVRKAGGQTQIVILEGPLLVEHYVARPDRTSMVGNIYLAKVRNVLPGMEASFLDFGAQKNGVLYAADVAYDKKK